MSPPSTSSSPWNSSAILSAMLNSGYALPLNGLGTYSLHGEECVSSVRAAIDAGVRLFDTASAYGNEEEVGRIDALDRGEKHDWY